MRVLVFGGRAYNKRDKVYYTLDDYHAQNPITLVIHGSCRSKLDLSTQEIVWSADELAEQWAKDNFIPYLGIPAVWNPKGYGKKVDRAAGIKRNALMLEKGKPQAGIGFPGGNGSADMAKRIQGAGLPLLLVAD